MIKSDWTPPTNFKYIQHIFLREIATQFSSRNRMEAATSKPDLYPLSSILSLVPDIGLPTIFDELGHQQKVEGYNQLSPTCKDNFSYYSFNSATVSIKRSHTSKLAYISQLALAGLRRTTSPWVASSSLGVVASAHQSWSTCYTSLIRCPRHVPAIDSRMTIFLSPVMSGTSSSTHCHGPNHPQSRPPLLLSNPDKAFELRYWLTCYHYRT